MTNYNVVKQHRKNVKKKIIYVMGGKCQLCGYNKCQSALELHHINEEEKEFTIGPNTNKSWDKICNELKKCVLVCANCHREIHEGLIQQELISSFNEVKAQEITNELNELKTKKINYCINCGKEIDKKATRCKECGFIARQKNIRPTKEELKQMIKEKSFTAIGQDFGVVDNTIRKWCISMNLPFRKKDIENISDEEWEKL